MNKDLKPVYTAQMLTGAKQSLAIVSAMGMQMQNEMLPALSQQLGMNQAQFQAVLGHNLPAMATGMKAMPQVMGRFTNLVTIFDQHLKDYNTIKSTAFSPIVWIMFWAALSRLLVEPGPFSSGASEWRWRIKW